MRARIAYIFDHIELNELKLSEIVIAVINITKLIMRFRNFVFNIV